MTPIEEILKQEITDLDGWAQDGKPCVSVLGGFFGQLMIVLNTIAKYYPQLDRPVRTGRSGSNRPKSTTSKKSGGGKSARSGAAESEAASEAPRLIITANVVQNFIYTYILEKLKSEKFALLVDKRYELFLQNLPNPMQLNEMRTMKPDKYEQLRALLSNFVGSPALRIIKDNMAKLDMDPDVFDLVYEGFWDLYTFHPQLRDVSARKLQGWIQKVRLQSGPDRTTPAENAEQEANQEDPGEGEEAKEVPASAGAELTLGEDKIDPVTAVVRLKIPKVEVQVEETFDDNDQPIPQSEIIESDLEDIPFEDRCLQSVCKQDDQQIWVINHLAQKTLRTEISQEFRAMVDRLEHLDPQDFNYRLEKEAATFEQAFLDLLSDRPECADLKTPKVPVFDFRPKY